MVKKLDEINKKAEMANQVFWDEIARFIVLGFRRCPSDWNRFFQRIYKKLPMT